MKHSHCQEISNISSRVCHQTQMYMYIISIQHKLSRIDDGSDFVIINKSNTKYTQSKLITRYLKYLFKLLLQTPPLNSSLKLLPLTPPFNSSLKLRLSSLS